MKHCGTQELTTERQVLRRMTTDDCEMMFGNWANDPEVTRYLRWEPHRDWVVTMAYLNEIALGASVLRSITRTMKSW